MRETAPKRYRLAAVTSHPVQYQAPLFQRLAAHPGIDLTVFYGHDDSIVGCVDPDFGVPVAWDRPLLDGYQSAVLRPHAVAPNLIGRVAAESAIIGHLRRGRFDAVFIHSYATRLSILAYAAALLSRTPILLRTESELLRPRRWWVAGLKELVVRPVLSVTDAVLVIGEANRRFFNRYGVEAARQFWTPYAVDNEFLSSGHEALLPRRAALRRAFGFPDDVVVVGFSGKLIPRKNAAELLDAVAALQHEGIRVGLLLVGDGPERRTLEERVRNLGLQWVALSGFRNQTELPSCYVCFDLFVLPARFDSWGLVVNEAMACGLPVVASSMVGAALDLIEPGRNGFVYTLGDVSALTEIVRTLAASSNMRTQFGVRSRAIVQDYSFAADVTGILAALRSVAGAPAEVLA